MRIAFRPGAVAVLAAAFAAVLGSAHAAAAQNVTGQASAVQAIVYDPTGGSTTTVLAGTGTLGGADDARRASQLAGSVPLLLAGETLHAATLGSAEQAASEASIADVAITIAGATIAVDFAMARVLAPVGGGAIATASLSNLTINGTPVSVTGAPNETIAIPGGQIVVNEQKTTGAGTVVNALHVIVAGVADLVVASAAAGVE